MVSEWTVVTVIIALVGLFFTVTMPIIKFSNTVATLITRFDNMEESDRQKDKRNKEIHDNLSKEIAAIRKSFNAEIAEIREIGRDHEKRIIFMEVTLKGGDHNDGAYR